MFLKNKNIIFKIRRSKVTDYAALTVKSRKFELRLVEILANSNEFSDQIIGPIYELF